MKQPLITVITAVYNDEKLLEQTILSVLNQSYTNVEYIIIDGGSIDTTANIIRKYQHKLCYWISEPDNGVYDAMNKGIIRATGDYIYFLGAGDLLFNVLHTLVPKFSDPKTIYYGNVFKLDEQKIYDGKFSPFKLAVKNICHQAVFYPRIVFEKYTYNLKYKIQSDHDLNMRCYGDKEIKFKYIPVTVGIYEGDGLSALTLDYPFFEDKLAIVKNNFSSFVYYYASLRNKLAKMINPNHLKLN